MTQLIFSSNPFVMLIVLCAILTLSVEISYQLGQKSKQLTSYDNETVNTIQAGLLTLVAFMLGLTYAQAQGRFDTRRELVVREANSIGTTWLRSSQLPLGESARFRKILTQYTSERLEAYSTPGRPDLYQRVVRDSDRQQSEMWGIVSDALRKEPSNLGISLLMSTLNDTIDVSSEQLAALTHHVPTAVIVLTFVLAVIGSISVGLRFARTHERPLALTALYVISLTVVLNLVIDYDRPRVGFIQVPLDPLTDQLHSMQK
jgi:hypothetical protein